MDRNVAEDLFSACEKTLASLTEAEQAIHRIADEEERKRFLRALSEVIAEVLMSLRAPIVRQHPELEPPPVLGQPDTDLSEEEEELVSRLKGEDSALIDKAILSASAQSWRKVARVVGTALNSLEDELPDVPVGYYARRIAFLVSSGSLESQGNLEYMRFSEVRLLGVQRSAA